MDIEFGGVRSLQNPTSDNALLSFGFLYDALQSPCLF